MGMICGVICVWPSELGHAALDARRTDLRWLALAGSGCWLSSIDWWRQPAGLSVLAPLDIPMIIRCDKDYARGWSDSGLFQEDLMLFYPNWRCN
jgi:hypothetical protein